MLVNLIMIVVGSIFLILAFAPSTRLRLFTSSEPGVPISVAGRFIFAALGLIVLVTGVRGMLS